MTNKVSIKRLDSITKNDTTATEQINSNFLALQEAIENTLSRDGTGPNFMDADLDMNSYRIINSSDPVEDNDIVNLKYVEERIGGAVEASKTAVSAASQAASSAQSALVSSTNAINTLRNAEEQLNNTITYVDEAKESIDEAITAATDEVKQQALDAAQESIDTAAEQATAIVIDYANTVIIPPLQEYVDNARESATSAEESSLSASASALSASQSASNAKTSETNAKNSASEAALHNLKNKITNCITEIPQDIKLELNDGTLTLKAGSKVYVPNGRNADGSNKFDVVVIESDISLTQSWGISQIFLLFCDTKGSALKIYDTGRCYSGTTSVSDGAYYNTNDNKLYVYDGGSLNYSASLPIAIIAGQSPTITSIDQVFNGFSRIGSTVFALPGVKGLIPNGRNADGSLRNIEFTINNVYTRTIAGVSPFYEFAIATTGIGINNHILNERENYLYNSQGVRLEDRYVAGEVTFSQTAPYNVTSFTPKLPFRAVDYNEVKNLGATITYWDE